MAPSFTAQYRMTAVLTEVLTAVLMADLMAVLIADLAIVMDPATVRQVIQLRFQI